LWANNSYYFNLFIFTLSLPEGRASQALVPDNNVMSHRLNKQNILIFPFDFPFAPALQQLFPVSTPVSLQTSRLTTLQFP
jgi:hypothetical protein